MMPAFFVIDGPTRSGVSSSTESSLTLRGEPLLGQLDPVPFNPGKSDFESVAVRADGPHLDGLARRLRRRDHRFGGEVKWDAQDIRVFDVEQALVVQVVGLPAQRTADNLLAE